MKTNINKVFFGDSGALVALTPKDNVEFYESNVMASFAILRIKALNLTGSVIVGNKRFDFEAGKCAGGSINGN